jgi:mannose-6-phosphate isomerase-like protein (cupin superfamily)
MVLGDQQIEVRAGSVVYIPRGLPHKAIGEITILTVCIPRGVLADVHELE